MGTAYVVSVMAVAYKYDVGGTAVAAAVITAHSTSCSVVRKLPVCADDPYQPHADIKRKHVRMLCMQY